VFDLEERELLLLLDLEDLLLLPELLKDHVEPYKPNNSFLFLMLSSSFIAAALW
jgi:hypothetical protein